MIRTLGKIFGLSTGLPPVMVSYGGTKMYLGLSDPRFESDPDVHVPTLDAMGEYMIRGGNHCGPAMSYYTDRKKTIFLKEPVPDIVATPQDIGKRPPPREFRASAYVAFTETQRAFGKRGFAMTIHRNVNSPDELYHYKTLVFGMFGIYDQEGNMTVKKLKTPDMDSAGRMTKLDDVPVTPENVKGALYYAKLCAEQIYAGKNFSPRQCLAEALNIDIGSLPTPDAGANKPKI